MEIKKAQWVSEGNNVRLTMPLSKVDKENRLVSGWASLDNADSQGDIVLKEANQRAFSRFRGNIREMHQPIAVGKMVDFKEDSYFDQETQKFYNGIFVTVYVSKGAQDTWEKVLDGTLQGFSIGGAILDAETQWVKDANATIRFVKDYELVELSLVDSPANHLANVFSITKSSDGIVMKGIMADTRSENVFYCETDGIAKTSSDESASCGNCGSAMQNIGWFEYGTDEDKTEKLRSLLSDRNSSNTSGSETEPIAKQEESPAQNEGGVIVAEENKTPETEVEAGSTTTEVNEVAEEGKAETEVESSTEAVAEKAEDNSEVQDEPDISKMFGDLQTAIESGLEKNAKAADEAIEKATKAFENKVEELVRQHEELTNKFESLKTDIGTVEKRLDGVESETAMKKSGDLGGSTEDTLNKSKGSKWGGRFLGISDLQQ